MYKIISNVNDNEKYKKIIDINMYVIDFLDY